MGIRIHKCIGYGLTDVKTKDYEIDDDRFYEFGAMGNYDYDFYEDIDDIWTREGFIRYLDTVDKWSGMDIYMIKEMKYWELRDMLIHNCEYGLGNVFLVIPPWQPRWSRYDNIIDYTEANGVAENKIEVLQQGIWPYRGLHQNQYGERLDSTISYAWWRYYNHILEIENQDHESDSGKDVHKINQLTELLEKLSERLGFKDFKDAKVNMSPLVPDIVWNFCEWTNIFTDPDTINQFRPLLYTYWG